MGNNATDLLRPYYFDRQQLTAADLNKGQAYLRERLRRHNRYLHGWGVVCGAVVDKGDSAGKVTVSEGYVVTPHGDEIYIPEGTSINILPELETCVEPYDPCAAVRIVGANIDPAGKDVRTDYNAEWVEVVAQERMNLDGYVVQHTINPGTPREAPEDYYTFRETRPFALGSVIRIHSGAQADHIDPEPGKVHRYVAGEGEVGNWRLNNTGDTIRVLNPEGKVVHARSFGPRSALADDTPEVYLIVCPCHEPLCPQPVVPEACQPPGGNYEWSRIRETFQLQVVCELPASHQKPWWPECQNIEAYVCGDDKEVPRPPPLEEGDNGVVLASIRVAREGGSYKLGEIDNWTHRRRVLSHAWLQAYLRCLCQEAPPAPQAAFTASPTSGRAPLTVQFTDQSSGKITAWAWSFDDGGASSQQDTQHIYQAPGTYTATLTVTGPGGKDMASDIITVQAEPPSAAFSADPLTGYAPLEVTFTDQSSGEIITWTWNFGDGNTSSEQSPVHTYQQAGTYAVELEVTGPGGHDKADHTITVRAEPPDGKFVPNPEFGMPPLKVDFTDQSSGEITDWAWDFGDGSTSNQQTPTHIYTAEGTYTVTLTVTGPGGSDPFPPSATIKVGRLILDIDPDLVVRQKTANPDIQISGVGLTDATKISFLEGLEDIISSATIIERYEDHIVASVWISPNAPSFSRVGFELFFPDGKKLGSGDIKLGVSNYTGPSNVAGESFPVELDEIEFDLIRGLEAPIEVVSGIGDVRGSRLREAGVDNVLALATLPPERTAEIAGVNVEMATEWQDAAREMLRRQ